MAEVTREHREAALRNYYPGAVSWSEREGVWINQGFAPDGKFRVLKRIAQAIADAEQRGFDRGSVSRQSGYSAARDARAELFAVIRRRASRSDNASVSLVWLDAFAPELVSGDFSRIEPPAPEQTEGTNG